MNTKFHQSWRLLKVSLILTLRHRKLLWFPVLTMFLTLLIGLFFLAPLVVPAVLHPTGYHLNQLEHWVAVKNYYLPPGPHGAETHRASAPTATEALDVLLGGTLKRDPSKPATAMQGGSPLVSLYLVVVYFFSMILATFFNVAYYSEILAALDGRGVSLRRGLSLAWQRMPAILAWSLLAGAVGWIIRDIAERLPLIGRWFTHLLGLTWSVAAVFVIPVIIREQPLSNPLKILKQSALTLKRTWGEGLIGYLGFSAGSVMIFGCSLVPLLAAAALALLTHSLGLMVIAGAIWLIGLLVLAYASNVAGHIYRCALYIYAAEGIVPEPYNRELLDLAWKVKKSDRQPSATDLG